VSYNGKVISNGGDRKEKQGSGHGGRVRGPRKYGKEKKNENKDHGKPWKMVGVVGRERRKTKLILGKTRPEFTKGTTRWLGGKKKKKGDNRGGGLGLWGRRGVAKKNRSKGRADKRPKAEWKTNVGFSPWVMGE